MKNVVHIIVDSLRYDCLKMLWDADENIVPNFSWIKSNSISFNNYFAAGAPTQMGLVTILSSSHPLDYGGYEKGLLNRPYYLSDIMHNVGYNTTGMIVGQTTYDCAAKYDDKESVLTPYWHMKALFRRTGVKLLKPSAFKEHLVDNFTIKTFDEIINCMKRQDNEKNKHMINSYIRNKKRFIIYNAIKSCICGVANNISVCVGSTKRFNIRFVKEYMKIDAASHINEICAKYPLGVGSTGDRFSSGKRLVEIFKKKISPKMEGNYIYLQLMDVHEFRFVSYDYGDEDTRNEEFKKGMSIVNKLTNEGISQKDAAYLAAIVYEDEIIGDILKILCENELIDNTIIAISADHGNVGFNSRSDVHIAKDFFDEMYHVPLLVYDGKNLYEDNRLMCSIDFAPTMLSLLEIDSPKEFKGVPFLGKNADGEKNEYVIMEHTGRGACDPRKKAVTVCVRSKKWKVVYKDRLFGSYEENNIYQIFDLVNDPGELVNLSMDEEALKQTVTLVNVAKRRMDELGKQYGKKQYGKGE